MVGYNLGKAKREALDYCKSAVPAVPAGIARHLKKRVSGFYPSSPARKITPLMKKDVLAPLEEEGFLVKYAPDRPGWGKARALLSRYDKKGEPKPRGVRELYHANFLYLEESDFPTIKSLPKPDEELNLDLVVLLSKFGRTKMHTWDMLNLLLCASNKENSDRLRLYLYKLPIDYSRVEILERVLEYGQEYSHYAFPFKPDLENAKIFLGKMTQIDETNK
jgi:hypothetical protein